VKRFAQGRPRHHQKRPFVINKTDLAPHVGADLEVMKADTARMRPDSARRPWVMTNLKTLTGVDEVVRFIEQRGMLNTERAAEKA